MSSMIERLPGWSTLPDLFGWGEAPGAHGIRIEEQIKDGAYVLRAELPGIDPGKEVEITVAEDVLTLRAERSEEETGKHHSEFRYGTFTRSVRLPAGAKGDEATAEYKDGVLTVTVPVPEKAADTRTIPVRHV
ncbi:Hsp20/alpha crystallin family protein [Streptomyces sp. H51]|uniref:Hsp20/alpha crystallin family protein n=1 Tax=Streptomyces sp. H51 TaxID=3111770 RepID=UPI002D791FFD|nr:Hsp20/alpha crystallin family protein [Streptomyces sp. H51]